MKGYKVTILCCGIVLLSACSKSETIQNPPHPLTEYPSLVHWQETGEASLGSGDGKLYVQLQPAIRTQGDETFIYAADYDGTVTAISMNDDAERLWDTDPEEAIITGGVGVGSQVVVIGTQKGEVIALSEDEGEELWRTSLSSEILSAPQSAHNVVVALTDDSRVFGLNAQTGEILWQYRQTAPLLQLRGSAPVIINGQNVYAGFANGFVSALDLKTGRLLWQQAVSYPRGRSELDRIVDVNGQMAVDDGVLYVVNYQGRAVAFDARLQRLIWEREFSSYKGLAVNSDTVFITDDESKVWALNKKTGDTLWRQEDLIFRELTAPVAFDNMIAVGDYEGYVHFIDAENGQLLGRVQAGDNPIHTPPVRVGDSLFVLSSKGRLTRFTPTRTP